MPLAMMRTTASSCLSAPLLRRPGSLPARAQHQHQQRRRRVTASAAGDESGEGNDNDKKPDNSSNDLMDLFAQELKRRGIEEAAAKASPSSSSSQPRGGGGPAADPFARAPRSGPRDETRGQRRGARPDANFDGGELGGQRERSMRLVSEGLDGLPARAKQLLLLGGSVFLGFLPAMLIFSLVFTGVFSVFGENFLHGGRSGALPTYVDPEELLAAPTVDRFVPFRPDDGF